LVSKLLLRLSVLVLPESLSAVSRYSSGDSVSQKMGSGTPFQKSVRSGNRPGGEYS
jgi:hypothetical protein